MKKLFTLILSTILVLSFSFSVCSEDAKRPLTANEELIQQQTITLNEQKRILNDIAIEAGRDAQVIQKQTIDYNLRDSIDAGMVVGTDAVNLYLEYMDYARLWKKLQFIKAKSPKKLTIHLFSFGGSVFDALAMAALIEDIKAGGTIVEIKAKGLAASAGLIILVSGSPGHRSLDKNGLVMFHELQSFTFLKIETPTSKENEAKVLRKIQDKVNKFISSNSNITFDELCGKIKDREWWLDAEEAKAVGLIDNID